MFTQFQNHVERNIGTSAVTLVTVPASNQLVVNQLSCANTTGFRVTCSVTVTRAGVTIFILNSADLPAGSSLICVGESQKIVLMAGDVLQVRSSLASSIDCVVSGVLNDFNRTVTVPAVVSGANASITVAPGATVVGENGTVTFTVTTNLPNGTAVYWENIGTTNAQDFTDDLNQGAVAVSGGSASFTRTLRATLANVDSVGESSETIVMAVGTTPRSLGGGILAVSSAVTVLDFPVIENLILHLDAGNPASYSGSGTTWIDLSGQGRNGTLTLGPTFNAANGGSIQFDNVDDYVNIPNVPQRTNGAFSYFSWAFLNAPQGATINGIWGHYATGTVNCHFETAGASNMRIRLGDVNKTDLPAFPVGQWVHAGFTTTGSEHRYYVNGVLQATWTGATGAVLGPTGSDPVHTVGRSDAPRTWNGRIATALLYFSTLTAGEVGQIFTAQRARFGV
jgi:hypothetical protein